MATVFNSCLFCNDIMRLGSCVTTNVFLITVLFVKTNEMPLKKVEFLLRPILVIFCRKHCGVLKIDLGKLDQLKPI